MPPTKRQAEPILKQNVILYLIIFLPKPSANEKSSLSEGLWVKYNGAAKHGLRCALSMIDLYEETRCIHQQSPRENGGQ